ncbi:MAG: M24 family metallopeptidase [Nitrospinota bacterium]
MNRTKRVEALRRTLEAGAGFLVTSRENVRYLSGFTGTAGVLLIAGERAFFLTDFRYLSQSEKEVSGMERRICSKQIEGLSEVLGECGLSRLKFEAGSVSFWEYEELRRSLGGIELTPTQDIVEDLRHVKDEEELAAMRRAVELTAGAWGEILDSRIEGVKERDLAVDLEFRLKRAGSERTPFDFIVASGERGALPHGVASDRCVGRAELVTFDFGACVGGYYSDLTRTVSVGSVSDGLKEIYDVVLEANRAGIAAVKPGVRAKDVDAAARAVIEEAGHGEHFGHGTGHGLGLGVHEGLRIAKGQERELVCGMVFTVEPGVYVPGLGGVRIEDMVLVTGDGAEVLTAQIPKELTAVG